MNNLNNPLDEKKKKRKKAGSESSKESSLRDWFGRKGAKGKKKGWVDCNAPDGKGGYKSCGRSGGEKRKRYPACRPTPGACKERGKGKSWGKKAKKRKNEELNKMNIQKFLDESMTDVQKELNAILRLDHSTGKTPGGEKVHQTIMQLLALLVKNGMDSEEAKEVAIQFIPTAKGAVQDQVDLDVSEVKLNNFIIEELQVVLDEKRKKKKKKKKKKGKKDACYHKVKSRYKVWPSAYASGALVKCRKVGAKNWGNSKKEALEIEIENTIVEVLEEKKKKPCKPSKGKRFAKRVNGKCRSFGQKGQAKGGGDRIRPGTKKGDAYCARSAKIKKCKNPPCANDLSRKKWKCRGSKSMREAIKKVNESKNTK